MKTANEVPMTDEQLATLERMAEREGGATQHMLRAAANEIRASRKAVAADATLIAELRTEADSHQAVHIRTRSLLNRAADALQRRRL